MNQMTSPHTGAPLPTWLAPLIKNFNPRSDAFHRQIAGVVLILFTFAGCDYAPGRRTLAEVRENSGNAFLLGPSGQTPSRILLHRGATIAKGQTIETNRGATVTISLMPALMLRLNSESSLSVESLRLFKSGTALEYPMKSRQARLRLDRGSLCGSTPPIITHVDLQISTPAGTVIAPALTLFSLGFEGEKIRAVVVRGQLNFRSKKGEPGETVAERQFAEWNATTGTIFSAPRDVETDQGALQALTDAVEFGRRAAELTAEARNTGLPGR